jgi:hypothetical protein
MVIHDRAASGNSFPTWLALKTPGKIIGGAWFLIGLEYCAIKTRGFLPEPIYVDFSET